jgi:hypothetical protein
MNDRKEYKRKHYLENKTKHNAWQRAYQKRTAKESKPRRQAYALHYRTTIGGRYVEYKCNANSRGHEFVITLEEFTSFWQKPCYYCDNPVDPIGLDRINSSVGYVVSNLVSCCKDCNFAKQDLDQETFLALCRRVARLHP